MATGIELVPAGGHTYPVGADVFVTRGGVVQPWNVRVFRHDRNRTYRLVDEFDTYVTVHEDELSLR